MNPVAAGKGILDGVRVIELSTVVAGPTCTALLADMGADVIKVEPPEGDPFRFQLGIDRKTRRDYRGEKFGSTFENCNRGKRSVVIDLKTPDGQATIEKLIGGAEVFVTNVRPLALEKLGVDYNALHKKYPRLVYAHLTAWGLGGEKENDPGYDIGAFFSATGMQKFMMADDEEGTGPPRFMGGFGDHVTSLHLLVGVLGAVIHQRASGEGQYVEASLYRAGIHAMSVPMILALVARATGKKYKAMARIVAQNPTYTQVSSRDGRWIQLLGLETPRHLGKLLKALGIDEAVKADPRFAPVGDKYLNLISRLVAEVPLRKEFNSTVDKAVKLKDAAEWVDIFKAGDVWHELAEDINDVAAAPNADVTGCYVDIEGVGHKLLHHPVKWASTPAIPTKRAPDLGAHTEEVLAELRK